MIVKTLILITLSCFSLSSTAKWSIGAENYSRHLGKIQTDQLGSSNFLEFNPGVNFAFTFSHLDYPSLVLMPNITIFLPESSEDDLLNKYSGEINLQLNYNIFENFFILSGLSYQLLLMSGSGGTAILNNGNATSSYFIPSSSKFSHYIVPEIGIGLYPTKETSLSSNLIIHQLLDSKKRTFSFSLNFNYWFSYEIY